LTKLLHLHVIPFEVISIGSYTSLKTSLSDLEAFPEVVLWKCVQLAKNVFL